MIGWLYFVVILGANMLGAVSGMGGGVLIKPIFDAIGAHSVAAISFYSAVAVFTMSIVSTVKQVQTGAKIKARFLIWIALGAIIGGYTGTKVLDLLLSGLHNETTVEFIQIVITVLTLVFALGYSRYDWGNFSLKGTFWFIICGTVLGFFASLLGIGGGPINVSLLMLMFGLPIKEATIYSIGTIFFSQLSKLTAIAISGQWHQFDIHVLAFVIPAAILGGFFGAKLSHVLKDSHVRVVFQLMILVVIIINLYNGVAVLRH